MPVVDRRVESRMGTFRIIVAIIIAIILIAVAVFLYHRNHATPAPIHTITQSQPSKARQTPPGGTVTEGQNPASATTPSPTGTNATPDAGNGR